MKGGPLQASLLLAFSGNVLGAAEAFDLSCAVLLFTIRATQVTATVDVLLAHAVTILTEIDVVSRGMTDSSTIDTTDGTRLVLLSEVPASTALCYVDFVEGDVSNNKVTKEEDGIVQDSMGIVTLRVLELEERSSDLLVLHVRGDPLGSLGIDEILEKVMGAKLSTKLFVCDQYVRVFQVAAWDAREHDFGGSHSTLHNSAWEPESLTDMSCLGFNKLIVSIWGEMEEKDAAIFCPARLLILDRELGVIDKLELTPDSRGLQAFGFQDRFGMFHDPRNLPPTEVLTRFLGVGLSGFLRGSVSRSGSGCSRFGLFLGRGVLPLSKTEFDGEFIQCHGLDTGPNKGIVSKPIIGRDILWVRFDLLCNLLLRLEDQN